MGAIGIARAFTFGGASGRALYAPSDIAVMRDMPGLYVPRKGGPTLGHFYEKLLKLKGLMKTREGRRLAEARHAHMAAFLAEFYAELDGQA
jgi:uncharacterized protein